MVVQQSSQSQPTPLRANAYVDAFNLYHGALKHRPGYKWLDLRGLCSRLLPPSYELDQLYYFTSRVGHSEADPGQPQRQDTYLRALKGANFPFRYVKGRFQTRTLRLPAVESGDLVSVRRTEEKASDVNLAARLVSDACDGNMDAALVVTDDFDQEGALKIVKEECGVTLIVASPRCRKELARAASADFTKMIHEELLRESQLPEMVLDHDGHEVFRPEAWRDVPQNGEAAPKDGLLSSSRSS
jgi:NYN domain